MPRLKHEIYVSGSWVDITEDVREDNGVTIVRGRRDEGRGVDRGRCSFKLNNRHGKYSEANPYSPYYGKLTRNTQYRAWVLDDTPHLWINGDDARAFVPSSEDLAISGDIDIRVDLALDLLPMLGGNYSPTSMEVIGRYDVSMEPGRMWRVSIQSEGKVDFFWSPDGSADYEWTLSEEPIPYFSGQRFALRVTLDADNGAGGHTVRFYVADTMDTDEWTLIGTRVRDGVTQINTTGDVDLDLGDIQSTLLAPSLGRIYKAEVRSGIHGSIVADADFTAMEQGTTSFIDSAGNEWSLNAPAEIQSYYRRFRGEISSWPQNWDQSGQDCWISVEASGPLRRMEQGRRPNQSPLRQRIPSGDPIAYWPMEDGTNTTRAVSPLEGVEPLTMVGVSFAAESSLPGSSPLPVVGTSAYMRGRVPTASVDGWHVELVFKLAQLPATEHVIQSVWLTGSRVREIRVSAGGGAIRIAGYDHEGAGVFNSFTTSANALASFVGAWNRLQIFTYVSGGTTYPVIRWFDIGGTLAWSFPGDFTGTPGRVFSVSVDWSDNLSGLAIGHLAVFPQGGTSMSLPAVTIYDNADKAFEGETAQTRIRRVAQEQQILVPALGDFDESTRMGPQPITTSLAVLRDAEASDGGVLVECRDRLALNMITRQMLHARPVSLILDAGNGELGAPLQPVRDDMGIRNEIVVTRRDGGSSSPATLEDGPTGVSTIGLYDEEVTLSLYEDEQTDDLAGWILHRRSVADARIPVVSLNLRNSAMRTHIRAILDRLDQQSLIVIQDSLYSPNDIRLIVEGYTERLSAEVWTIELNCSPATPWDAWVIEGFAAAEARLDTDGSSLAEPVSDSATQLTVISDDVTWVTADEPLNDNPYFDTDISGWVPMAGAVIAWDSGYIKMVTGGAADNRFQPADYSPVTSGSAYSACAWVHVDRPVPSQISVSVNWYDASNIYMATTTNGVTVGPDEWTFIEGTHTAPVGAAGAKIQVVVWGTPGAGTVLRAKNVAFRPHSSMAGDFPFEISVGGEICRVTSIADVSSDTQTFTVERSLNGIEMEHPAGTPVALAAPTYLAPGE